MIKPQNLIYLQQLIYEKTGVIVPDNKQELIKSRLKTIAATNGFPLVDDFLRNLQLQRSGNLHIKVIDALMTNETQFFRETHIYRLLQDELYPMLMTTRQQQTTFNIWSAACSTGQEPYSIAMQLSEEKVIAHGCDLKVFASDVSEVALSHAKQGLYSEFECSRGLTDGQKTKFFESCGSGKWKVKSHISSMIQFEQVNIIRSFPNFPLMDVIFLRNVLIYFDAEHKANVLRKIKKQLKPDGFLIVGTGETPDYYEPSFEPVKYGKSIVYRLKQAE